MFKPGTSATAAHILQACHDPDPAVRVAICEEILTFADLEDKPGLEGFAEVFAGEDQRAKVQAANAMARNGILEPRDLAFFRRTAMARMARQCARAA